MTLQDALTIEVGQILTARAKPDCGIPATDYRVTTVAPRRPDLGWDSPALVGKVDGQPHRTFYLLLDGSPNCLRQLACWTVKTEPTRCDYCGEAVDISKPGFDVATDGDSNYLMCGKCIAARDKITQN